MDLKWRKIEQKRRIVRKRVEGYGATNLRIQMQIASATSNNVV